MLEYDEGEDDMVFETSDEMRAELRALKRRLDHTASVLHESEANVGRLLEENKVCVCVSVSVFVSVCFPCSLFLSHARETLVSRLNSPSLELS